jgi:hypothetical protein
MIANRQKNAVMITPVRVHGRRNARIQANREVGTSVAELSASAAVAVVMAMAQLSRVRGSRNTYMRSASMFAMRTVMVMTRKMPCMSG